MLADFKFKTCAFFKEKNDFIYLLQFHYYYYKEKFTFLKIVIKEVNLLKICVVSQCQKRLIRQRCPKFEGPRGKNLGKRICP